MGGSADHRYNQTFIVQQSAMAGMPIVAVSINYRLSSWGFLYGKDIQESGNTMLGFRDQRLALHWVQENIAAFGGDPSKVTIQGESSGGTSVGAQLLAYNGRDDKLFSGAIAESGNPVGINPYPTVESWAPVIANVSRATGCSNATDLLTCLRAVPVEKLNEVFNSSLTSGAQFGPVIDGDFIVAPAATQLKTGAFVHVPYLVGCNSDEGTGFGGFGYNTTSELKDGIETSESLDAATAHDLLILYPDIPDIGVPSTYPGRPNGTFGLQFKRASALFGDIGMHGPRRWTAMQWVKNGAIAYTYRFNVVVSTASSRSCSCLLSDLKSG
jgi:carboxylesterase type B